jgi:hypothetical protein
MYGSDVKRLLDATSHLSLIRLWKLINIKCIKKCMDIEWFNGLKYTEICSISYETCRNLGHLKQFAIMMCRSRTLIII